MKKIFVILLLHSFMATSLAQTDEAKQKAEEVKEKVRTASDLKTGKSQDVLISFFQLAFDDFTGKDKSFKFQSSLFALKAKTDKSLFIDENYLKQKFARNLVFNFATNLDTSFKFKSSSLGIKYAIVNNRDKTVFDFILPSEDEWVKIEKDALNTYAKLFTDGVLNPNYLLAQNFFLEQDDSPFVRTPVKKLPEDFKVMLTNLLKKSKRFEITSLEEFRDRLTVEYTTLAQQVEKRGLWTVDGNFSTNTKDKLFSKMNFNSEYLKGIVKTNKKMGVELNLKASLEFDDDTSTILTKDLDRQVFSFSGGFNWIICKNKRSQSIIEFKGALSYNNILKGRYQGEEWDNFTGEGTLRIRVTNDIWIPVDIKYDPLNGKVFGFLSVRSNFDWLKTKK